MKEEITSKKKLFKVKKECDSEGQETFAFILFYYFEKVFVAGFIYFFFPWLIINHKHECIQAKTIKTQVSLSLDSVYTH